MGIGHFNETYICGNLVPTFQDDEITRDQQVTLRPGFRPTTDVPAGMALVTSVGGHPPFAVGRTEVTVDTYTRLLRSIDDKALAAEMVPAGWLDDPRGDLPVRGLSHRQARVAAALLGGHLLSEGEYVQAATGGLRGMPYPWGRRFDVDRVVGDPRYASEPLAARSRPGGASPHGILHLVGNIQVRRRYRPCT